MPRLADSFKVRMVAAFSESGQHCQPPQINVRSLPLVKDTAGGPAVDPRDHGVRRLEFVPDRLKGLVVDAGGRVQAPWVLFECGLQDGEQRWAFRFPRRLDLNRACIHQVGLQSIQQIADLKCNTGRSRPLSALVSIFQESFSSFSSITSSISTTLTFTLTVGSE